MRAGLVSDSAGPARAATFSTYGKSEIWPLGCRLLARACYLRRRLYTFACAHQFEHGRRGHGPAKARFKA